MLNFVKACGLFSLSMIIPISLAYADLGNKDVAPIIYKMNPISDPKIGDDANENVRLSISTATELVAGNYSQRDLRCLSEAIYYEARGEGKKGAIAVAEVVLNRAKSSHFPNSVCGVVYSKYKNICQFSFVCNGAMKRTKNQSSWEWSQDLAKKVMNGNTKIVSNGALFFHAYYVKPSWARKMQRTAQIGAHSFYKPRK